MTNRLAGDYVCAVSKLFNHVLFHNQKKNHKSMLPIVQMSKDIKLMNPFTLPSQIFA